MIFIASFSFFWSSLLGKIFRTPLVFNLRVAFLSFSFSFRQEHFPLLLCSCQLDSCWWEGMSSAKERFWRCAQGRYTWLTTGITEIHGKLSISFLQYPLKNRSSTVLNMKFSRFASFCCLMIQSQIQTPDSLPAYMKIVETKENNDIWYLCVAYIFQDSLRISVLRPQSSPISTFK